MKIIKQIGIIFFICWIAQILESVLPIDFPASVIGMVLLFLLLASRILKVDHIREKSDFLLANMAFFFIPAGVSIINYFDVLQSCVLQLIFICLASTVVTFAVTAYSMKLVIWLMGRKKKDVHPERGRA
ncbi:MAG: CidA/LrgA family protein [Eubacteriales bacterium]|nr:CidA/LrgA family protein [Eubacteriales bacterium]